MFLHVDAQLKDLQKGQELDRGRIDALWQVGPRAQEAHDRLDSMELKIPTNEEFKAAFFEVDTEIALMKTSGNESMKSLRLELQDFANKVHESARYLKSVDEKFEKHVVEGFRIVQDECQELRKAYTETLMNGSNQIDAPAAANVALQVNFLKARIDTLTKRDCHCIHFKELAAEVEALKALVASAAAMDGGIAPGPPGGPSAPGGKTEAQMGESSCGHCEHVTELQAYMHQIFARVEEIERRTAPQPFLHKGVFNGAAEPQLPEPLQASGPQICRPSSHPGAAAGRDDMPGHGPGAASGLSPFGGVNYDKLFDEKLAASEKFAYGGEEGAAGEKWRKTVRGYLITRCPELNPILNFCEAQDDKPITRTALEEEAKKEGWMMEINFDKLSVVLWGFLQLCLKGEAKDSFEEASELDGINGWRLVIHGMRKSRWVRLQQLRKLVRHVKPIARLEDVASGILTFDKNIKDFVAAGGRRPDDADMIADLQEALPLEVREGLHWRSTGALNSYEDFRNHVRSTASTILFQRGKFKSPVQHVEDHNAPHPSDGDIPANGHGLQQEIFAVLNKFFGGKGGGRGQGGPGAGGGGPGRSPPRGPGAGGGA